LPAQEPFGETLFEEDADGGDTDFSWAVVRQKHIADLDASLHSVIVQEHL
jgi:hypothetical protein